MENFSINIKLKEVNMDKKVCAVGLKTLSLAFSNMGTFDKPKIEVWYSVLKDIPEPAFLQAISFIVKNDKWAPVPARIIEVAKKNGDIDVTAEEAWLIVNDDAKKGEKIKYRNPTINFALQSIGGWDILMYGDIDKMGIYHSQFIKAFESFEKRKHQAENSENAKVFMSKLMSKLALQRKNNKALPQKEGGK
jgi:hypothetical protein